MSSFFVLFSLSFLQHLYFISPMSVVSRKRKQVSSSAVPMVSRCYEFHMRFQPGIQVCKFCSVWLPRGRCSECSGFKRLLRGGRTGCIWRFQHRTGLIIQRRTDAECKEIMEILAQFFSSSIVLMIIDFDHGGDPIERMELAAQMAREVLVTHRGDAFAAV